MPAADQGGEGRAISPLGWLVAALAIGLGLVLVLLGEQVAPPVGRGVEAPDFQLSLLAGQEPVSLSGLRGQVVLLNFWATWCKPCEDEMPAMERLYRELKSEGFELLAVSVDRDRADVEAFQSRLGLSFPIALNPSQDVARQFQTTGFPESLLIDRGGRIVERYVGPRDWDAPPYVGRIRELLVP